MKKVGVLVLSCLILLCTFGCDSVTDDGSCLIPDSADSDYLGTLNGYRIYRNPLSCEAVVGRIIVDGYDFGFFWSGCDADLNSIGYYAKKLGITYQLQDLVDRGELTTKEIYEKIYVCDADKKGVYE